MMHTKTHKTLILVLSFGFIVAAEALFECSFSKYFRAQVNTEKKERWQAMEKEVESWVDGLGLGIDQNIKKVIIVLNLIGFKTNASCEGHLDRGLAYPWVDFETDDVQIEDLVKERQGIYKLIGEKESEVQKKYPNLSQREALRKEGLKERNALYQNVHSIDSKIETLAKTKLVPLKDLLGEFYKNRSNDSDRIITINAINPTFLRMYSVGGDWQITRSESEKAKKLKEYQQEMNAFADFLTDYYFK